MKEVLNIPRPKLTLNALRYPALVAMFIIVGILFDFDIFISSLAGILVSIVIVMTDVLIRAEKFKKYLTNFGVKVDNEDDHELSILGLVPFRSKALALESIPDLNGVEIIRDKIERYIVWDDIEAVKSKLFLGKPVLILNLNPELEFNQLIIPWCDEAFSYLPERLTVQ